MMIRIHDHDQIFIYHPNEMELKVTTLIPGYVSNVRWFTFIQTIKYGTVFEL